MENSLVRQKQILFEINKIIINFGKCSKVNKTAKYKQSRLELLSKLKTEYDIIYTTLALHNDQNPSINETHKEFISKHKEALEEVENFFPPIISQTELTFEELINTILSHLQQNLSTIEFEDVQKLVDSHDEDDTKSELYQSLLENVLTYHTKRENCLIQENAELIEKIGIQKKLTKTLQEESDAVDSEVNEQIKLIEELQKERNQLHKKINRLETDRKIHQEDFNQEELNKKLIDTENELLGKENQIFTLKELLSTTQNIHNKAIGILKTENKKLKNFIIKLTTEQKKKHGRNTT